MANFHDSYSNAEGILSALRNNKQALFDSYSELSKELDNIKLAWDSNAPDKDTYTEGLRGQIELMRNVAVTVDNLIRAAERYIQEKIETDNNTF